VTTQGAFVTDHFDVRDDVTRDSQPVCREPYRLLAHKSELRPGLEPSGFNSLADELETDAIMSSATLS
jgi:hypothetical protein